MTHSDWAGRFSQNPLAPLLDSQIPELTYFINRDLLGDPVEPVMALWERPEAVTISARQQDDGSWRYPGKRDANPYANYDLVETYRQLRVLVDKFGFMREYPCIPRAAEYIFSCQNEEGAVLGILGTQYIPYYQGVIMELLIKAGYVHEPRIKSGFKWLLSMRQDDGGWIIPMQVFESKPPEIWGAHPKDPDRSRPFSTIATGMVLRAFAAHPEYRCHEAAREAGELLKSRFFKPDKYNDRKASNYWTKFQYPFWWPNLLTALDSLSLIGFTKDDPDIDSALVWFHDNQNQDGLWDTGYNKAKDKQMPYWVALAVCRVFQRYYTP